MRSLRAVVLIGLWLWLSACAAQQHRTPEQEAYVKGVEEEGYARIKALNSSDVNESQAYLERYPDAPYRQSVVHHLATLTQSKEKPLTPEEAYAVCRQQDSIPAYQGYLFSHGTEDRHHAEALARLDELLHPGGQLAQNIHPSETIVTSGSLSQQYETLGTVEADTTDIGLSTSDLRALFFRAPISRAIQGSSPKLSTSQMDERLKVKARQQHGAKVDAVINVTYRTNYDGDVYASGLAVHFAEPAPVPAAPTQTLEQKLTELKSSGFTNLSSLREL